MSTEAPTRQDIEMITAQELADALGVSLRQVRRWTTDRTIPCHPLGRRAVRYKLRDVYEWLEKNRRGPGRAA